MPFQRVATQDNNLTITHPELTKQWHECNVLKPDDVTPGSQDMVWWRCPVMADKGHIWQDTVRHRTAGNRNCPFCSNHRVDIYNCLAATHPWLVEEWNFNKNVDVTPYTITYGHAKKIWWICKEKRHEWQAVAYSRSKGSNCPYCKGRYLFYRGPESEVLPEQRCLMVTINGETRAMREWAHVTGIDYRRLHARIKAGISGALLLEKDLRTTRHQRNPQDNM